MSNFLKMVNSNNFINTIENEKPSATYNIQNQQIGSAVLFKQMELREMSESTNCRNINIANMLFVL